MIDRKALVRRHNVTFNAVDPRSPLTVGNGNFAFTADVTGLQTIPDAYPAPGRYAEPAGSLLGTQATWGWHSSPVAAEPPLAVSVRNYPSPRGPVPYVDLSGTTSTTSLDGGSPDETWLRNNPHRLMLGAVALAPESIGLENITADDITAIDQTLDLWQGLLSSNFTVAGADFQVQTVVDPCADVLAVSIRSTATHPPAVRFSFPYGSEAWGNAADWNQPDRHVSDVNEIPGGWEIRRFLDDSRFTAKVMAPHGTLTRLGPHEFLLVGTADELTFCVEFAPASESPYEAVASYAGIRQAAADHWQAQWRNGGMIEFSGSSDPRAAELERRVVLSQYLMAVNCSGSAPPQETGLAMNSWRGRFHLEMHWWHGAHFPLWNRAHLLTGSLDWYFSILDRARETAAEQGFSGVRWPKQVAQDGRESPSDIGPFLIWQQPHPIYLAELIWRDTQQCGRDAAAGAAVLEKYSSLVFETAAFMASFGLRTENGVELAPPLVPAQESYGFMREHVENPTFELAYWSWALETAQLWRRRMGLAEEPGWSETSRDMVKPHSVDGVYSAISVPPFTIRTDHPSMLAGLGMVPQTPVIDPAIMDATLDDVLSGWDWESTWGWDYPMIAMTAARLNRPNDAVDALMMERGKNTYLANGHNFQTDALPFYLPGNGGLLAAVALMAAGYDGGPAVPGFPRDGTWTVVAEDILPLP